MSDSATPWTAARQAPLSVAFPRQESWSGLPFPSPRDHVQPLTWVEPVSPALTGRFFTTLGSPWINPVNHLIWDDDKCYGGKKPGKGTVPVRLEVRGRHLSCDIWAVTLVVGRAHEVWDGLVSPPGRGTANIKVPEDAWNMQGLAKKPVWLGDL